VKYSCMCRSSTGPIYEYPLMGFEPAISRVTRWSPRRIVGSSGAGEAASADGVCSARHVLPIASAEPVAAAESPKLVFHVCLNPFYSPKTINTALSRHPKTCPDIK
jgi:hypothetical protein